MAGLSIAERAKLSVLLARRALAQRRRARCAAIRLIRWSFVPRKADRLLIAPQDLRTADATRASEIYAGRFAFAGKVVICDGRSPFEIDAAVRGMGGGAARLRLAAPSARRRIRHHARQRARAGRRMDLAAGLAGTRSPGSRRSWRAASSSWLSQAPLILHDADDAVLSPLPAQPDAPGPLPAPHRDRRRATACRACRR